MNTEDLYTYIGYVMILVLVYLICKTLIQKRENNIEGFMGMFKDTGETTGETDDSSDPRVKRIEQNVKDIVDETNKTIETMNLLKYRSHWENLIVAMEDRISSVSLQSLPVLAEMIKKDPNDGKLGTVIDRLNILNKFRETLKDNMRYLDGLK
jgi:hypothetical protein